MVHLMRKYLSNRGSALFMVLSTMTALMITCMAMYFAVLTSRSTQYAVFNQQQSYQSGLSVADMVISAIKADSSLQTAISGLTDTGDESSVLTTDGTGFDDFIGGYNVAIERLPDEEVNGKTCKTYDVIVTTSVNGVREVVHRYFHVAPANSKLPPADRIFASTGYTSTETMVNGGTFSNDLFFDNESASIKPINGGNVYLRGNIGAGGSLTIRETAVTYASDYNLPSIWAINGDLTIGYSTQWGGNSRDAIAFPSCGGNKIIVGRNLIVETGWQQFKNVDVYVLGNVYFKNGVNLGSNVNTRFFVKGTVEGNQVYGMEGNVFTGTAWANMADGDDILTAGGVDDPNSALYRLMMETSSETYFKWEVNDSEKLDKKGHLRSDYLAELDPASSSYNPVDLWWNNSSGNSVFTNTLTYGVNGKGCVIKSSDMNLIGDTGFSKTGGKYPLTLIIDTGDSVDNVFTVRCNPLFDLDGDGMKESFTFWPSNVLGTSNGAYSMIVLVKGRGSVVFDIAPGCTFQDVDRAKTLHYNWFVLNNGVIDEAYAGLREVESYGHTGKSGEAYWMQDSYGQGDNFVSNELYSQFVHRNCDKDCSVCSYTEKKIATLCDNIITDDNGIERVCNTPLMEYTCTAHGSFTYCPECDPYHCTKDDSGNIYGMCNYRVDHDAIDSYSGPMSIPFNVDSHGDMIYPTTNIFLISCDESADIRLVQAADGGCIMQNSFFGFIYAPYMAFYGYGGGAGRKFGTGQDELRLMGGLIVADYMIYDSTAYLACKPDKMPFEMMSAENRKNRLESLTSMSWKMALGTY